MRVMSYTVRDGGSDKRWRTTVEVIVEAAPVPDPDALGDPA